MPYAADRSRRTTHICSRSWSRSSHSRFHNKLACSLWGTEIIFFVDFSAFANFPTYVSVYSEPHENVVVYVPEGDDVLQTELENVRRAELLLMWLVLQVSIEISTNRAIHDFRQQHLLIWTLFAGLREPSPAVSVVWILVTCGGCQSFHLITLNSGQKALKT